MKYKNHFKNMNYNKLLINTNMVKYPYIHILVNLKFSL